MTASFTEITVIRDDATGMIARVPTPFCERGVNIKDLDQAVQEPVTLCVKLH